MKTIAAIFVLVAMPYLVFSQRQINGQSRNLVQFGHTYISITNNFITNSGRKFMPVTIQFPFQEEVFGVTGPQLNICVVSLDSDEFFRNMNGMLRDTMAEDKQLFSLSNLQISIKRNNYETVTWKDVIAFPVTFFDSSIIKTKEKKPVYSIFYDTLSVNDSLVVELRSKQKPDAVFRMRFVRVALPVFPFLAIIMHDSSGNTSETEFIKKAIETENDEFKSINSFYKDWPPMYGKVNNNQRYFSSSKLAYYFRVYNKNYPDSSLEYALVTDDNNDTIWHNSGHLILITRLEANKHYTLLVRYKESPDNIWENRFYVGPKWFQTNTFKLLCGILGGIVATTVFFIFFFKNRIRKEKQKKEKLQLEQRAVRSQLNPHFTFNALSSIQSLMNQNKISEANYYFTEFSSLLRESLRYNEKEMLPLHIELQTLENYIKLEQLRFPFSYEIFVEEAINTSTIEIPSLLLQPLVENAIKHGISRLQKEGNIVIETTAKEKDMMINITDNGTGFSPQEESKGYGLSLTKQRIKLMNQSRKEQEIRMIIISNATGTTLTLHFINWI